MNKSFLQRTILVFIVFVLSCSISYGHDIEMLGSSEEVRVEGTELSRLHSFMDVLRRLPGVNVTDDGVEIPGRGNVALYIGNRRVTELSEISQLPADKVKDVTILRQPGAEYAKEEQSVIIIHLRKGLPEGLFLENKVSLGFTHKASVDEELALGFKHRAWTAGAFLGWNESHKRFRKENFSNTFQEQQLVDEKYSVVHPDVSSQVLTLRLNAAYAIHADHMLSASYSLKDKMKDNTVIPEFTQRNTHPNTRHDMSLEYSGKFKNLTLFVGNNSYLEKADLTIHLPTKNAFYLRDEFNLRSYAKARLGLGKTSLTLGTEHEYKKMEVDRHDDEFNADPYAATYYGIHANHPDHTLAFFASAVQQISNWTFQAGLRYEHIYSAYLPCDDDGLMNYLKDYFVGPVMGSSSAAACSLIPQLFIDGKLSTKRDFVYPSFKVSTQLNESRLTLLHSQNSVRPYLGLTRLQLNEFELMQEKILWTEKVSTTTLDWQWRWLGLQATHTHYQDPICSTLNAMVSYNAPDYDAFDIDLNLTPRVGIWSPMLHARFHKQWFEMPLADGKDKLKKTLFSVHFNNSFNFPYHWLLLINADWNSRGAERNVYFYKNDFCIDASLQKKLPRQGLTISLEVMNVLHNSYYDVTKYVKSFYGMAEGAREHRPRMAMLTVKYKL